MRSISTHLAALGIAGLVTAGALTPATAQTWSTWNNGWNGGYGGPFVSADVGLGYGTYGYTAGYPAYGAPAYGGGVMIQAPVAGTVDSGFYAPGTFGYRTGRTCVTDEGYGRVFPCDHGGGF